MFIVTHNTSYIQLFFFHNCKMTETKMNIRRINQKIAWYVQGFAFITDLQIPRFISLFQNGLNETEIFAISNSKTFKSFITKSGGVKFLRHTVARSEARAKVW